MPTITVPLAAGADWTYQSWDLRASTTYWLNFGDRYPIGPHWNAAYCDARGYRFRFTGSNAIPKNATITSVKFKFRTQNASSGVLTDRIFATFENNMSAPLPTSGQLGTMPWQRLTRRSAAVTYFGNRCGPVHSHPSGLSGYASSGVLDAYSLVYRLWPSGSGSLAAGTWYECPTNLGPALQKLVDDPDWSGTDQWVLFWWWTDTPSAAGTDGWGKGDGFTWNNGTTGATSTYGNAEGSVAAATVGVLPQLIVSFEEPGTSAAIFPTTYDLTSSEPVGPIKTTPPAAYTKHVIQHNTNRAPVMTTDLYVPNSTPPAQGFPLVIWAHGGFWVNGNKTLLPTAWRDALIAAGIAVASIDYENATDSGFLTNNGASHPIQVKQFKTCAQYLQTGDRPVMYNLNPNAVFLSGFSAGGNLALEAAVTCGDDATYTATHQSADPSGRNAGGTGTYQFNFQTWRRGTTWLNNSSLVSDGGHPTIAGVAVYGGPVDLTGLSTVADPQRAGVRSYGGASSWNFNEMHSHNGELDINRYIGVDSSDIYGSTLRPPTMPILFFHGTNDTLVPATWGVEALKTALQNAGYDTSAAIGVLDLDGLSRIYVTSDHDNLMANASVDTLISWITQIVYGASNDASIDVPATSVSVDAPTRQIVTEAVASVSAFNLTVERPGNTFTTVDAPWTSDLSGTNGQAVTFGAADNNFNVVDGSSTFNQTVFPTYPTSRQPTSVTSSVESSGTSVVGYRRSTATTSLAFVSVMVWLTENGTKFLRVGEGSSTVDVTFTSDQRLRIDSGASSWTSAVPWMTTGGWYRVDLLLNLTAGSVTVSVWPETGGYVNAATVSLPMPASVQGAEFGVIGSTGSNLVHTNYHRMWTDDLGSPVGWSALVDTTSMSAPVQAPERSFELWSTFSVLPRQLPVEPPEPLAGASSDVEFQASAVTVDVATPGALFAVGAEHGADATTLTAEFPAPTIEQPGVFAVNTFDVQVAHPLPSVHLGPTTVVSLVNDPWGAFVSIYGLLVIPTGQDTGHTAGAFTLPVTAPEAALEANAVFTVDTVQLAVETPPVGSDGEFVDTGVLLPVSTPDPSLVTEASVLADRELTVTAPAPDVGGGSTFDVPVVQLSVDAPSPSAQTDSSQSATFNASPLSPLVGITVNNPEIWAVHISDVTVLSVTVVSLASVDFGWQYQGNPVEGFVTVPTPSVSAEWNAPDVQHAADPVLVGVTVPSHSGQVVDPMSTTFTATAVVVQVTMPASQAGRQVKVTALDSHLIARRRRALDGGLSRWIRSKRGER